MHDKATTSGADAKRLLAWFAGLCLLLCVLTYWPILRSGNLGIGNGLGVLALMWRPGLAALLTRLVVQRNLRGMGWRVPGRMLLLGWALPLLAALLVYGAVWITGLGGLDLSHLTHGGSLRGRLAFLSTAILLQSLLFATGEELGWRGLLLPELARLVTPARAAAISGIAWALYHYPAIVLTQYHSTAPRAYALTVFTLTVFAVSFLLAWLRLRSGSFWPAAMLHASHNLYVQQVFDPITVDRGLTPYLTTEFGAGLCLVYFAAAIWLWRRYPPSALSAARPA